VGWFNWSPGGAGSGAAPFLVATTGSFFLGSVWLSAWKIKKLPIPQTAPKTNTNAAKRNRAIRSDDRLAPAAGASSSLTSAGNPSVGSGADLFDRFPPPAPVDTGVEEQSGHGFVPISASLRGSPHPGHATVAIVASRYFAAF
jgi:hypothetical protein